MKTFLRILLLFTLLIPGFCGNTHAQEKYSKVKIYMPEQRAQRVDIIGLLQIDHYTRQDGAIIAEIGESDIRKLKTTNYRYEVLIDDVTQNFLQESQRFFAEMKAGNSNPEVNKMAFDQSCKTISSLINVPSMFTTTTTPPGGMGGFYTLNEMGQEMDALVAAFPNLVQKTSIGSSTEGRAIWCIRISDNVSMDEANEPEILYLGLQHAREAIGGTSLIFFAQYLAQNYATDNRVKELVDNRAIYIIPCVNPDGYERNRRMSPGGGGMQRKNRRKNTGTDSTRAGVDLNRNYGVDWNDCAGASTSCGSGTVTAETYWGTSSFSEPETRAIRDFCYSRNFVIAFDQHCAGPYYSLPFGRRSYHSMSAPDQRFYTYVPALLGKYNGHRAGDSKATVAYEVAGGAKDWWLMGDIETFPGEANKKGKIYGMTGEAGGGDFWAPSSSIIELCRNLCFQNLQLALVAGSYVDLQDAGDMAVTNRDGNFSFNLRRVGLGSSPVSVSIVPIQNIQSVGTAVSLSLANYYDAYTGNIDYHLSSSLSSGQRIKFAWKIETGGITLYDTVTKIFEPVVLLNDNMEGSFATNWSSSSDVSGTAGNWAATNLFAISGTRSLTESPLGNYTGSTDRILSYNGTFDLSDATAAYLGFWVRHRAENFRDRLLIQVSTNGTSWTSLCGKNTIAEPSNIANEGNLGGVPSLTGIRENWTREQFDLSSYIGVANLRLRFRFLSDNTPVNPDDDFEKDLDDGFYLDDVQVMKSTTSLMTLPVKFIQFTGRLLPDQTIRLDWDATTDQQHDHFEIEKSGDGIRFTNIGNSPALAPYWKIDPSPYNGNNYYRVKAIDKDGTVSYSTIVTVAYFPMKFNIVIYPNPVLDRLTIQVNDIKQDRYTVQLTDASGRVVYREKLLAGAQTREVNIDLENYAAQLYFITMRNSKDEVIVSKKIMKE